MRFAGLSFVSALIVLSGACTNRLSGPDSSLGMDEAAFLDTATLTEGSTTFPDIAGELELWFLGDVERGDIDFEFTPLPGDFLWPCSKADDCLSNYCVETTKYGSVCTIFCETECPLDWKCKSKTVGSDVIFLCAPPETDLCKKCTKNEECGTPEDLCLPVGTKGETYCAIACARPEDCPTDYRCEELEVEGKKVSQCLPESGSCVCLGELNGATQLCSKKSEFGECVGKMTCNGPDGWSECSAPYPTQEVCDGEDNDCDGKVDEDLVPEPCEISNEYGVCEAMLECQGADGWQCPAQVPTEEICDGVDNNCDGQIDEAFPELGGECDSPEDDDLCALGKWTCRVDGLDIECIGDIPQPELCNGIDDDCDGEVDDPWPDVGKPCDGPDPDACRGGVWTCSQDGFAVVCIGDDENFSETCDGVDNDCNGVTDDGFPDYDFDLIADCVDLDDDGDGVPEDGNGSGKAGDMLCKGPLFVQNCDDNCPLTANPDQLDNDADGIGDLCDDDDDNDGVKDPVDNCKFGYNPNQKDTDGDKLGDVCDFDMDGDGVNDDGDDSGEIGDAACAPGQIQECDDNCPLLPNPLQEDADNDGMGDVCDPDDDNDAAADEKDCAPFDATIYPGAVEVCNGKDDNCDTLVDPEDSEGCGVFYIDVDGDGFGFEGLSRCVCGKDGTPPYTALSKGDCNDSNPNVHPLSPEVCNELDDDCDGVIDNAGAAGCVVRYADHDKDGYGVFADKQCVCGQKGDYTASLAGDCDDSDPKVHPGAPEYCNGKDDNCDTKVDGEGTLGCNTYYIDQDNDGYGLQGFTKCLCKPSGSYKAELPGDCNDTDKEIHPGMKEICDGKDNDCDSKIDEEDAVGCKLWYQDIDSDGWGDSANVKCLCGPMELYTASKGGDCNDNNKLINGGTPEICNNQDDDCDGMVDEDTKDCNVYYFDEDQDGYGVDGKSQCLCFPGQGYTASIPGDCDDNSKVVHPGVDELCNGQDDDCDGVIDNEGATGCTLFYEDADGDGHGNTFKWKCLCGPLETYKVKKGGDCDDTDAQVHPGMNEVCDNKDNNCDKKVDEAGASGCVLYFKDSDGDGYGVSSASQCTCLSQGDYTALVGGDCNDNNFEINPGVEEICDGVDNNCIGGVDEGFPDNDGDGTVDCIDNDSDGDGDPLGSDCNDEDPTVNHFAVEKCNGKDDNCNGILDDENALGCQTWYKDADQDEYGLSTDSACLCGSTGLFSTTQGLDCDDTKPFVHPGALEQCNGIDDNCNGATDEGNAVAMCGLVPGGTPQCINGVCSIAACEPGFYDLDNVFENGCECQKDNYDMLMQGNTCGSAVDLGTLQDDGSSVGVAGNLVPAEDEDWFTFTALDGPDDGCNDFTLHAEFSVGADQFRFEVYKGGCDKVDNLICKDTDVFHWTVDFYDEKAGECPCSYDVGPEGTGHVAAPGKHFCQTHTDKFYLRVIRKQGVPASCAEYKLSIRNGKP